LTTEDTQLGAVLHPEHAEEIAKVDAISGEIIGTVDRHTAHIEGIWHRSTHVWIIDASGHLLFQQRAEWVRRFPSMWDISAAGHTKVEETGLREVTEELGVEPVDSEMEFVGVLTSEHDYPGFHNRERPHVWLWRSNLELADFSFPDDEAMALAAVHPKDICRFLKGEEVPCRVLRRGHVSGEYIAGKNIVPQSREYWEALHSFVKWDVAVKLEAKTIMPYPRDTNWS
jgi:isopentenyldiphosphate isomerase